ncbi:MAG: sugar phosphate isomerase/epimerase family protein [Bacteroidota bacterium]
MNVKFGASLLSWIPPMWTPEGGRYAIEKTAQTGFDLIEILLPNSMNFDAKTVKAQLRQLGLGVVCSLNLPKEAHIPAFPNEAVILMKKALDKTAELDTDLLAGVLHSGIGCFSGNPVTEEEKEKVTDVWGQAAAYADKLGITIAIEPINRYESYVCNTAANVLELIGRTGAKNLALHLDTFHMNIEEDNFYDPIIASGKLLKHLHITESNRGMPGEGTVNWDELFKGLKDIQFEGNLVLENFSSAVPGMQQAVSLWQTSPHDAESLATGSLKFLKEQVFS